VFEPAERSDDQGAGHGAETARGDEESVRRALPCRIRTAQAGMRAAKEMPKRLVVAIKRMMPRIMACEAT